MSHQRSYFILTSLLVILFFHLGTAFAATVQVNPIINKITFDKETNLVRIEGLLPSRCTASPRAKLVITKNPEVLILDVVANQSIQPCIAIVGSSFELVFDLRTLSSDLIENEVNLSMDYKIISRDGTFFTVMNFSNFVLEIPENSSQLIQGAYAVENDGNPVVILSNDMVLQVVGPKKIQEIIHNSTSKIEVQGYVLDLKKPKFFVIGFNAATY
ncbi:MAG: hypothetical protein ABL927_00025 [Bdellovibrionales bacterium]